MIRHAVLSIVIAVIMTGCASHYHRVNDGMVHLYLKKSDAGIVWFASSLDGFDLHKARKADSSTWEVVVPADAEFRYFYMIDGKLYIPPCRNRERDDFGSENCLFIPGM